MSMNRKGNFTKATIRILRDRVASLCSNPNCRKFTVSAHEEADKITIIGEGAHICAVSQGGARFDSNLTLNEIKSYDNGIWLCTNCHTMIDREPKTYTVKILNNWKQQAEAYSRNQLNTTPKSNHDIVQSQQSLLTVMPLNGISNAIQNIHKSVSMSLEELDNRFTVRTTFSDEKTSYKLFLKENQIPPQITVTFEKSAKLSDMIKHGLPVTDLKVLSLNTDSDLLNHFTTTLQSIRGTCDIREEKKLDAEVKTLQVDENRSTDDNFTFRGKVIHGIETFSFFGMLDDFLSFELIKIPLNLDIHNNLNLHGRLDYKPSNINNMNLKSLNVKRVHNFLDLCIKEKPMKFELFIRKLLVSKFSVSSEGLAKFGELFYFFDYLYKAQKICQLMDFDVNVNIDYVIPEDEYIFIEYIYNILFHNALLKKGNLCSNPKMNLEVINKNQILELNGSSSHEIKIIEDNSKIYIFGEMFNLPNIEHDFIQFKVNVLTKNFDSGDAIDIELIPEEYSLYQRKIKL